MAQNPDVIIVGGGHNGLTAAILLARARLNVLVLEQKDMVGGAVKTEFPFKKAPRLGISSGAYLLGLMPPEIIQKIGLNIRTLRRDPHYFLPTTDNRYLLLGSDEASTRRQFLEFFSEADWNAHLAMNEEIAALRDDLAPSWLLPPLTVGETAERFIRAPLRKAFLDLCTGSVGAYLERWGFKSDLIKAMYAVTDGFSGVMGGYDSPGTGLNFLSHNMCRLPGSGGTWMIVEGGMGAITRQMRSLAEAAGATVRTGAQVARIESDGGSVTGVALKNGEVLRASTIIINADPFTGQELIGKERLTDAYNKKIDGMRIPGSTMKVNMALSALPEFTCLKENRGQYGPTIHLLPDEKNVMRELREAFEDVQDGRLPRFPSIEWYIHTEVDPSLKDDRGWHNSALFVQWVPHALKGTTWDAEEQRYVKHLLSICDRFAPNTSRCVEETMPLTPPKIEQHFGIRYGQIQHVDNRLGFDQRLPYETPIGGLYYCSAGCHPAGGVIGAAGHNAANVVLRAMGKAGTEGLFTSRR